MKYVSLFPNKPLTEADAKKARQLRKRIRVLIAKNKKKALEEKLKKAAASRPQEEEDEDMEPEGVYQSLWSSILSCVALDSNFCRSYVCLLGVCGCVHSALDVRSTRHLGNSHMNAWLYRNTTLCGPNACFCRIQTAHHCCLLPYGLQRLN